MKNKTIFGLVFVAFLLLPTVKANAQTNPSSVLYVPLIGITSVPTPLALPKGPGQVTYNYAVKNFLQELPLIDIKVVDDHCSPVKFIEGDDNADGRLDYNETWRYRCVTTLATSTQSIATVSGSVNDITAKHNAYATVVVGSNNPPPLISIVNITKVAYPLSLPAAGGKITFTYKVTNPGVVPLSEVTVADNKCRAMSGKLGDVNGNDLLDIHEVWIYTCTMNLRETTTNTVTVTASANGLKATDSATITVKVQSPGFPAVGTNPNVTTTSPDIKITVWGILAGVLVTLIFFYFLIRKGKLSKN